MGPKLPNNVRTLRLIEPKGCVVYYNAEGPVIVSLWNEVPKPTFGMVLGTKFHIGTLDKVMKILPVGLSSPGRVGVVFKFSLGSGVLVQKGSVGVCCWGRGVTKIRPEWDLRCAVIIQYTSTLPPCLEPCSRSGIVHE